MKPQEEGKNFVMRRFINFALHIYYQADKMKDIQIGGACSAQGRDEEYIQAFSRKPEGDETCWKTWLAIGELY